MIEGFKLLEEAIFSDFEIESVFCAPLSSHPVIDRAREAGVRVYELEPGAIERISDTVTPQPVVSVARLVDRPLDELASAEAVLVLADVRDPGNAGTIMRSAEASGIGGVVFCDGSVDLYNSKTVRSSAGSIFQVPVSVGADSAMVMQDLREAGFVTVGTVMEGGSTYDLSDLTRKVALVFGNEASGLPETVADHLDEMVTIPIEGRSESLNVSMAASILCFELARQRRAKI